MSATAASPPAAPPLVGRPSNPNNETPTPDLVAFCDFVESQLYDFATPEDERENLSWMLHSAKLELAERLAEFVRADDGLAGTADLAALARGTGIVAGSTRIVDDAATARLERELARREATIATLRRRVEIRDQQLAAHRNANIGAAKATAAALIPIFLAEQPAKPNEPTGWRVPLAKLAEATGLSEEACSRHTKALETYTLPDGTPLLHRKVVPVGEGDDTHKELWIGPGTSPDQWAAFVAGAAPAERKKWGGKRDGVCLDHPDDGVIELVRDRRIVTYECATCRHVVNEQVTPIGKPRSRWLPRVPTQQDAGCPAKPTAETAPIPQLAGTLFRPGGDPPLSRGAATKPSGKLRVPARAGDGGSGAGSGTVPTARDHGRVLRRGDDRVGPVTAADWAELRDRLSWAQSPPSTPIDRTDPSGLDPDVSADDRGSRDLSGARDALADADHATDRDGLHRATEELGNRLEAVAKQRGKAPVPKPAAPEPPPEPGFRGRGNLLGSLRPFPSPGAGDD
jgi:hypothetical protein